VSCRSGTPVPRGEGDGDASRLSATFGLAVGGREVSDPHDPLEIPSGGGCHFPAVLALILAPYLPLPASRWCPAKALRRPRAKLTPGAVTPLRPHPACPRRGLRPPSPVLPGRAGVVQLATCPGFALLPWKCAAGISPGLQLRGTPGTLPVPFCSYCKGSQVGGSERTLPCPCACRAEIWALPGRLGYPASALPRFPLAKPEAREAATGAGHPKAGQAEAGGSPRPPSHQGIFIYTKWSSSIRRRASSALAGSVFSLMGLRGWGAQTPGGLCRRVGGWHVSLLYIIWGV